MVTADSVILLSDIKATLETMRTILEIQARPSLKAEINALAPSTERRKMWILSDGEGKTLDIGKRAGLKVRAAEYFVEDGIRAGLLVLPKRGYPKRRIDFIPDDWEEIKTLEAETPDAAGPGQIAETNKTEGGGPDGHT